MLVSKNRVNQNDDIYFYEMMEASEHQQRKCTGEKEGCEKVGKEEKIKAVNHFM